MAKNERTSMFNEAQMRDRAEKEAAIQNQETSQITKEKEKQLLVRLPYSLWRQLMMRKIETGDSMNTSILKSLKEYLRND